jgi:hypothetical protein
LTFLAAAAPSALQGQAPGKFPPDSLVNVKVIARNTPVQDVVGIMRNLTIELGVRCQFCHVGEEGMPLARFDFASDQKRTKQVARQMMLMVQEINRRVDTIPHEHLPGVSPVKVTCETCHRGVSRPAPLYQLMVDAGQAGGLDSATRLYRTLRERYYGRAAYDFAEPSLNIAAFRLGRAQRYDEGLGLLRLNEEQYPKSSGLAVFRGNILLMRADTNGAAEAFREAIRRDSTNLEARGRLRTIGRTP